MYHKTCRCGQSSNMFKRDIGPFYIEECCEAKGYDFKGNLKATEEASVTQIKVSPPVPHVIITNQQVQPELPKTSSEVIKDLVQQTKRKYSRKAKNESPKGS